MNKKISFGCLALVLLVGGLTTAASTRVGTTCSKRDLEALSGIESLTSFTCKDPAGNEHTYFKIVDHCWLSADVARDRARKTLSKDKRGLPVSVSCVRITEGPHKGWHEQLVDIHAT